jgi:hypothetical protein
MYLFCNSRIHVITLYSSLVCVYYASILQCCISYGSWLGLTNPYLGVGYHTSGVDGTSLARGRVAERRRRRAVEAGPTL